MLTKKKINQDLCKENLFSAKNSPAISKKKYTVTIEKYVENSRRKTVLNEKGRSGFCQFLNFGMMTGVFCAQAVNCTPNFLVKNSSSEKIIRL